MGLRPIDYAMGVAVPFAWSMGFVYAKAAIDHFPPIFLMSMRFTIAAILLVWFARVLRG
jgi:O-acetylserine/cysteine efflux transporter